MNDQDHQVHPGEETLFPEIHLWDYVQIVMQRLPLAIITFLAVMALAVLYTWTRTPKYTAKARLLIETSTINLTNLEDTMDPTASSLGKREFMQTQARLITSRDVLDRVITKLNLRTKEAFADAKDPVRKLSELLTVTPVRNTYLIDVSAEMEDRQLAASIVNATLEAHLAVNRKRRLGISDEGIAQLDEKAGELRARLETATAELQAFMVTHNMVSFEKSQSVVMARLQELSSKLNNLQPQRISVQAEVEAADEALAAGQNITALPSVLESPIIKQLRLDLANLQNEYSQLLLRLGENHPKLQAITSEIDSLQTRTAMEASSILESKRTRLAQLRKEEALLSEAITAQEDSVREFNRLADRYNVLKDAKDAIEGPYNRIMTRVAEIDISRIGAQGENMFVDYGAVVPHEDDKSGPSKAKNLLVAFVLGSGLALGLCFFLDYMDTTIKGDSDVRRFLGSRVLASLPSVMGKQELKGGSVDTVVGTNPRSHTAEAFRALRTALTFSVPGERIQMVVVSSTLPSEGKSLTSCNLAMTQALAGKRTLLIDADMRKPRLHHVFELEKVTGIGEILKSGKKLDDLRALASASSIENLWVLPCGQIPRNPAELLESPRFAELLGCAREQFDFIVIDSPPGFTLVDSLVIAKQADGIVLVLRSFVTPKAIAQQFTQRLHDAGVRLLGVCLNNVSVPGSTYGYSNYRYGKYYRKYYEVDG